MRCDMKNSKDNSSFFSLQSYGKLFGLHLFLVFLLISCGNPNKTNIKFGQTSVISEDSLLLKKELNVVTKTKPTLGIERIHLILDSLKGKRIAVVANQTSVVNKQHLVDTLLALKLNVVKVFAPEHGFRGQADAGEKINHSVDSKTGLPLVSLYGNNKKPSVDQLKDVDVIVFDIQDVGVRFYTFISTLHYVMEAAAENGKKVIVLDRPNPNAHYIDGPVLEKEFTSFVGMHPVPIVYGMTIGEYAMMINGENWLENGVKCDLSVLPCKNYTHQTSYSLPIAPSPNLKTDRAIALYPSLCLFEGTTVSLGRGTERPFELYGHPKFPQTTFEFTPIPMPGAKTSTQLNKKCNGYDLSNVPLRLTKINLEYLINANKLLADSGIFINQNVFFNRLAGNSILREQLHECWSEEEIRATWKTGIDNFKVIRSKYLLYE
jgi:uncharacterized protein YbbC (DUF1343 family)